MYRLGIDIGGTFTDAVSVDERDGSVRIDKVFTTTDDPSAGFLLCVERLSSNLEISRDELLHIVHANTVATNAVLERKGARAGFLVTEGFRDLLEIGRQIRYELYNLQTEKPAPLIPRERCVEVRERINYQGEVLVPLDEESVIAAVQKLLQQNVESLAVCFLHSYQNPTHEKRVGEIIKSTYPQLWVSVSSDIAPEIREYWRASTTVTNSYIAPIVTKYLEAVEDKLRAKEIRSELQIMQSNGGVMTVQTAKQRPVYMLESGPAAGVISAKYFTGLAGFPNAISFDMGGTTAKMGLIVGGEAGMVTEFEAGGISGSGTGVAKGSGYPILTPVIDVVEVGAGGGSIAWIDPGGLLRVGPKSSGAVPGPACYGRGGTQPTIADANLLLGRLNPSYFLGGEISLNVDASRKAIETHCAKHLGFDPIVTSMGILDIANATMADAIRLISVQRGHDPREFCLIAVGGAGPMHANHLALEMGIPAVVIPPSPGVASALGMLTSDLRHDYCVTHLQKLDSADLNDLNGIFHDLRARGLKSLAHDGVRGVEKGIGRYVDMRYVGQSWKLRIAVDDRDLQEIDVESLRRSFDLQHERAYGYSCPDEPTEIVNVGVLAVGDSPRLRLKTVPKGSKSPDEARKGSRPVYFHENETFVETPVFDRYALHSGNFIIGPAIVEEMDSTTVIHPRFVAEVISFGILVIRRDV
jgi:N-methylhydantoinase A